MSNELNSKLERNTSFSIVVESDIFLDGWTLIYKAKQRPTDEDADAIISITPTTRIIDGSEEIVVSFLPSHTKSCDTGYLYHSLRAISSDSQNVLSIFNGTLKITQNGIQAP